jgi:hypothetical protein
VIAGEPQVRIKVVEGVQQPSTPLSTSTAVDLSKSDSHSIDSPIPEKMGPSDGKEEWA